MIKNRFCRLEQPCKSCGELLYPEATVAQGCLENRRYLEEFLAYALYVPQSALKLTAN